MNPEYYGKYLQHLVSLGMTSMQANDFIESIYCMGYIDGKPESFMEGVPMQESEMSFISKSGQ